MPVTPDSGITVNIVPTANTMVEASVLDQNFCTEPYVGINEYSLYRSRILFRFPLSSIPVGSTIETATLNLFQYSYGSPGITCYIKNIPAANRTWDECTVTWTNQPSFETVPNISFDGANTGHKLIDITQYIADQFALGLDAEFYIISAESTGMGTAMFYSTRQVIAAQYLPSMSLTYIPPQAQAQITAIDIVPSVSTCEANCGMTVTITWKNNGEASGSFVPGVQVGTETPITQPEQTLAPGATYSYTFSITGLMAGSHTICPVPN